MGKRDPEKQKEYSAKKVLNLTDSYIANRLGISVADAREVPELIEIKRLTIQLGRALKEKERKA